METGYSYNYMQLYAYILLCFLSCYKDSLLQLLYFLFIYTLCYIISKLQESLQFHSEDSREQQHIDAALNEKIVQEIESRIDMYKKERDTAKENLKQLKINHEERFEALTNTT